MYPGSIAARYPPDIASPSETSSVADEQWSAIFEDPAVERLVKEAIANNPDVQITAQRVLEAQAQVGVVRSQQLPAVNAGGSYTAVQLPSGLTRNNRDGTPANSFFHGGGPSASAAWNLDFWGLYRRQTEAARAEMLASIWGQRAAQTTLIQSAAEAYFQLSSLDAQLEVTNSTITAGLADAYGDTREGWRCISRGRTPS
jgi:multidrug efflux system outer membrane protein